MPRDLSGTRVRRYAVERRLGSGGQGEVYLALDPTLRRQVALKRVSPHLRSEPGFRDRLLKEARRASRLHNAHIAAVHDAFEEKGELFLVMEYAEGPTLRERLRQPLPVNAFLDMAEQCVDALDGAHSQGIVHLDLKPENIILGESGSVKVLDFGMAKQLPSAEATDSVATTRSALSTSFGGTMGYTAPEVLLQKSVDARADIFSMGVVFYEALAGSNPFRGSTPAETVDRVLHMWPEPLRKRREGVPRGVSELVERMLAKSPDERYPDTAALRADLGRLREDPQRSLPRPMRRNLGRLAIVSAAVVLLLAVGITAGRSWQRSRASRPPAASAAKASRQIAVMPLRTPESSPEAAELGAGLAEVLTARLTQLTRNHPIQVAPVSLLRRYGPDELQAASTELGLQLALTGSLRLAGDRLRVSLNLVDPQHNRQLDATVLDVAQGDPFALEDQMWAWVLHVLGLELTPEESLVVAARGTEAPTAYQLAVDARGSLRHYDVPEKVDRAVSMLEEALAIDPGFAPAQALLGRAYWQRYRLSKEPAWVELATSSCQEAVRRDGRLSEAHLCLGDVLAGTGAQQQAAEAYRQAAALDPTSDDAFRGLAKAQAAMGLSDEAEQTYRQAIDLRPSYWANYNWLGGFFMAQGRYDAAEAMYEKVIELVPDSVRGYRNLGGAQVLLGHYEAAVAVLLKAAEIAESRPEARIYINLAGAYFYMRRFDDAVRAYETAVEIDPADYAAWGNLADACYWAAGRRQEAMAHYRHAIELGERQRAVNPRDANLLGELARYEAMVGETEASLADMGKALELAPHDPQLIFIAAIVRNQLGDRQAALERLEAAVAEGLPAVWVRDAVMFDNLRDEPRLKALEEAI